MEEGVAASAAFQSLVGRSVTAWHSINYVGRSDKAVAVNEHTNDLSSLRSIEAVLESQQFWFFQIKEAFVRQNLFTKWDPNRLDEYILLPAECGFVSNRDCFFISHYWRTHEHPDPEGEDLRLCREDLETAEYSYIWVDWTCMPQVPRTEMQQRYFKRMLRRVPIIMTNCGFQWRYPKFEPRAWILLEAADLFLNHSVMGELDVPDDMKRFQSHVTQMLIAGVSRVTERYGYKCADEDDLP